MKLHKKPRYLYRGFSFVLFYGMIMVMDELLIYIGLGLLGLTFGSFAAAKVWRLRAQQLVEDKAEGEEYDKKEYQRLIVLTKHTGIDDRSRCLSCEHQLSWYDLLPLASWLSTRGKCRYCHAPIGRFEPLMELGVAAFFVVSYALWPSELTTVVSMMQFGLWLVAGVMMAILFAYDLKWFLLPSRVMMPLIAVSVVTAALTIAQASDIWSALLSLVGALLILSGLYFVLNLISKGKWIGFGDVYLGLVLALLLSDWQLAFVTLFAANLIGCIVVIPGLITGKLSRTTPVPFGPMMIAGFLLAFFYGQTLITWYLSLVIV